MATRLRHYECQECNGGVLLGDDEVMAATEEVQARLTAGKLQAGDLVRALCEHCGQETLLAYLQESA
ncbi:MAG: hypothetical protein HYV08_16845 [Deltaproteobacteria bacterium]|nr:hypothetical protein [Deltaproteobacteria bacterium]MBI3077216.1 hypothetical protein [Deltaproteobacteria bacterium]